MKSAAQRKLLMARDPRFPGARAQSNDEQGEQEVDPFLDELTERTLGSNSKTVCKNRDYFLLLAACSKSQGAEAKRRNIYYVPTPHQTCCCLHF